MDYVKKFFRKEDGVETIEFIGLIAVAAALVAVIAKLGAKMTGTAASGEAKMNEAVESINSIG